MLKRNIYKTIYELFWGHMDIKIASILYLVFWIFLITSLTAWVVRNNYRSKRYIHNYYKLSNYYWASYDPLRTLNQLSIWNPYKSNTVYIQQNIKIPNIPLAECLFNSLLHKGFKKKGDKCFCWHILLFCVLPCFDF